jgi:hypothetical protein
MNIIVYISEFFYIFFKIDLSPCILARIILEEYLSNTYCQGESGK